MFNGADAYDQLELRHDKKRQRIFVLSVFFGWWVLCSKPSAADILLGIPRKLDPPVNSTMIDESPSFSPDGLTMYFASSRSGGIRRLFQVTRENLDASWESPEMIENIPGPVNGSTVSSDGLELYFANGWGLSTQADIFISRRASPEDPWGAPEKLGAPINTRFNDDGPFIAADGLSLYFSSNRSGGFGANDLYVTRRETVNDDWGTARNLGADINSHRHDWMNGISTDGQILFLSSLRDGLGVHAATRASHDEDFSNTFRLSPLVNTSPDAWRMTPSPDGSSLYYTVGHNQNIDIMEVELLPFEAVTLNGAGGIYAEDFNSIGDNTRAKGTTFPIGWSGSDNGIVFESTTTRGFPASTSPMTTTLFYNAGGEGDTDRALAIGVTEDSGGSMFQLLADVVESDANAFNLQFDIEAWDAARGADSPGEAAFRVLVEADSGDGFLPIADLGSISTGTVLQPPDGRQLDGNLDENRTSFDSGIRDVTVPAGSTMRIRWIVPDDRATADWVFGLDNVSLSLFGGTVPGDLNGDGVCDVVDIDLLSREVIAGRNDLAFDVNSDELVNDEDRRVWVEELKNTYFGDSNLDGQFDTSDLVAVFTAGEYEDELSENSTWSTGDWNGDMEFDSGDLVKAFQASGFEVGPRTDVNTVPEPSSLMVLLFALTSCWLVRRRSDSSRSG